MDETSQNYVRGTHLTDIPDLRRIARGVNMDITQLDAGSFASDVVQLKVRNILASLITSNRRLRIKGNVDFLTFSFVSQELDALKWRGVSARQNHVLAASVGETFDLVVPPGVAAYCVSVIGNAEATLRYLGGPALSRKLSRTAHPIPCDSNDFREMGGWLAEQVDGVDGNASISDGLALELEQEYLRRLAACMRAGTSSSTNRDSEASGRIDLVQRVERHLLHDLALPQTIDDLCRIAGTSRRTLEYAFRDYFGTSPKQFIKSLRLNAARYDLLRGEYGSAYVVEIASGWGFTHMGQFSSDYRHMFAERPSDTLRRTPSRNRV
jgi:AraC-like DNA-binding protein